MTESEAKKEPPPALGEPTDQAPVPTDEALRTAIRRSAAEADLFYAIIQAQFIMNSDEDELLLR